MPPRAIVSVLLVWSYHSMSVRHAASAQKPIYTYFKARFLIYGGGVSYTTLTSVYITAVEFLISRFFLSGLNFSWGSLLHERVDSVLLTDDGLSYVRLRVYARVF